MAAYPMRHMAIASSVAIFMVILIPDEALRYGIASLLMLHVGWLLWVTLAKKKPPITSRLRQQLMAYHIDRGLELARNDEERAMLLSWIDANLGD